MRLGGLSLLSFCVPSKSWVLLVCVLCWAAPAAAQSAAERAFDEGSEAFEAGDDQRALSKMREAFELQPDYRTAAGLGQVELQLLRYRDAAEHLEYSLRHFPEDGDPQGRELVMKGFSEARGHVVTLSIEAQVPGARLLVDGEPVATLPVEHDLFIEPGEHRLEFVKAGFEGEAQSLYLAAGSTQTLTVDLRPALNPAGTATDRPLAEPSSAAPFVLIAGGVVTLAGLGTGAGFHWAAGSAQEDADELRERLRATGVACEPDRARAGCSNLQETLDRVTARRNVATVAFVASGGAALATLLIYSIVLSGEESPAPARTADRGVALLPMAGTRTLGMTLSGNF